MIIVRPEDVFHKAQLLRLLIEIADHPFVSTALYFKGGTCASMLGFLDRFSVDLDFDLKPDTSQHLVKNELLKIFQTLGLIVKAQSKKTLSFVLQYKSQPGQRNTLKLTVLPINTTSNAYQPQYLGEIDRILICQTIETMVANKLVAPLDRYRRYRSVAGRDFYDINHFFLQGYDYQPKIIVERTHMSVAHFLKKLIDFTEKKLTQTVINEDLNVLLPKEAFQKIRKTLKTEVIMMLHNELERIKK
ncbi:nucleotidyl transferase AbiEii/AbiGii toxin family protein [Candidatus Gottesmanbacteria bacterium]|nr:nucleotidyl transferase AbiEii/AbiGii toxin family protein [Candidatus Gottesmanbacteria bacterium]MBI5465285.1 nucleotidyl transferase AbiEii/AbiGii toxin family protein [Candidatus Gottesmanbacteria bacterium]